MATDEFVMKRPGFIKYLDVSAVEQSWKPNPLRSASILIFHDEIELFLQLAFEYQDASNNITIFYGLLGYNIRKITEELALPKKASMERISQMWQCAPLQSCGLLKIIKWEPEKPIQKQSTKSL